MIYPSADILENWGAKYALVVLAAKRAKQVKSGTLPMIPTDSRNPLTVALEEIAAGKVFARTPDNDEPRKSIEEPEVAQLLAIPRESDEEAEEILASSPSTTFDDEIIGFEDEDEEVAVEDKEEPIGLDEVDDEEDHTKPYASDEDPDVIADPDIIVDLDEEDGVVKVKDDDDNEIDLVADETEEESDWEEE
jgi:DNA-directed RNA polymerase subunit omega